MEEWLKVGYGFLGLQPKEVWRLCIHELMQMFNAKMDETDRQFNEQKWLVWHTVALDRMRRMISLHQFMKNHSDFLEKAKPLHGEEAEQYRKQHEEMIARMEGRA